VSLSQAEFATGELFALHRTGWAESFEKLEAELKSEGLEHRGMCTDGVALRRQRRSHHEQALFEPRMKYADDVGESVPCARGGAGGVGDDLAKLVNIVAKPPEREVAPAACSGRMQT
jgi:hypothetical protein